MRRILASLGSVLCAMVLASCSGGDDGPDLATIQVTPDPITLAQQQTSQLQVSVLDTQGQLVTGVSVTFTATDAEVASVTNTGLVTASKSGTAGIRIKAGDLSHLVPVTVTAVSNAIVVTPNPGVVAQNATLQLTAVVNDLNGLPIPGAPVAFQSAAPLIAMVSPAGLVTPLGPAGQAPIIITSGSLSTTVPVAVTPVATSLEVAPNPTTMLKGGVMQLAVTVKDRAGAAMTGIVPAFQSSNTGLATVSSTGLVQGKGSTGSLSIQVTAAGLTTNVPVLLVEVGSPQGILDGTSTVPGAAYGIAVSPAGVILVSGTITSRATLTDRTFSPLVSSGSSYQYAPAVAMSGTSAWIAGLPDNQISEVNATTGAVLGAATGGTPNSWYVLKFSTDGSRLFAAGSGRFSVVNPATRAVLRDMVIGSSGLSLVTNPVGTTVFVGGYGPVEEITPSTGASRIVTSEPSTNFTVSPDGQFLYLVSEGDPNIKVVRVSDGGVVKSIPVGCSGWGIAISPDGQKLYDTCGDTIFIVDVATDGVTPIVVGGNTRRTAFSMDGRFAMITNEYLGVHFIK